LSFKTRKHISGEGGNIFLQSLVIDSLQHRAQRGKGGEFDKGLPNDTRAAAELC